jgi:drug/metabolite transporter superfamily protein YnfA
MAIGYLLVCRVGEFQLRRVPDVAALAVGGLLMALMLARAFGRVYGG